MLEAKGANLSSWFDLFVGGERSGVRDPAAEEPAPRAHRAVLRLPPGPRTEEAHHFRGVHARGRYSAGLSETLLVTRDAAARGVVVFKAGLRARGRRVRAAEAG